MNFLAFGVLCSLFRVFIAAGIENYCHHVPTTKVNDCCKMPELYGETLLDEITTDVSKQFSHSVLGCKIREEIFKRLNLIKDGDIDKAAVLEYIDNQVEDFEWKNLMKTTFEFCNFGTKSLSSGYQIRFNVTKEQCNMKYPCVLACIDIMAFSNCPNTSWTESEQCNRAKVFAKRCMINREAMEQFSKNQLL